MLYQLSYLAVLKTKDFPGCARPVPLATAGTTWAHCCDTFHRRVDPYGEVAEIALVPILCP